MISWNLRIFSGTLCFLAFIHLGYAIKCWDCNSAYEPKCADPFDNGTIAMRDCSQKTLPHFPNQPATICRKIIQKVNADYRYIRSCGWLNETKDGYDCIRRAGTFNIMMQYCSCNQDGCNAGTNLRSNVWYILAPLFVVSLMIPSIASCYMPTATI